MIDLDTERITSFRLKPWADSYLRVCARAFAAQESRPLEIGTATGIDETVDASQGILAKLYAGRSPRVFAPPAQVRQIRNHMLQRRHAEGESLSDLAREFGISPQRVHQIVRGKKR